MDYLETDTTPLKKVILLTLARDRRLELRVLAHRVGCGRSTLCVALEQMRDDGWLSWNRGSGHPNFYWLHPERIPRLKKDSRIPESGIGTSARSAKAELRISPETVQNAASSAGGI